MQAAVIAAEDRTFYSNRGIDIRGIIRAARDNAQSGAITGGGSTITQQYVKILYLSQERSYTRKVREAILSIKIHNQLSKQEILEGYLNTIYFGNGAYGVQVASRTYFDKPASELDVQESAALATILNQPSFYDPYIDGGAERMLPRYQYVLEGMAKAGAISAADAAEASEELPKFAKQKDNNRFKGPNGHVLRLVQQQMNQLEFTDSDIQGGGLKITTTIGYQKQRAAIKAVETVRPPGKPKLHAALVSVQPGTGAVRAMYGGPDYLEEPAQLGDVRHAARIDVQGVRADRGARGRLQPQDQAERKLAHRGRRQHHREPGRQRRPVVRSGHARARHPEVHQHRVRRPDPAAGHRRGRDAGTGRQHRQPADPGRHHGRHREDPRRRQAGRHPAVGPRQVRPGRRRHAARLRAGAAGRHGERVRDARRRRQEVGVVRHREGRGPERRHAARARASRPSRRSRRTSRATPSRPCRRSSTPARAAPEAAAGRCARPWARPARPPPDPTRTSTCRRRGSPAPRPSWPPR